MATRITTPNGKFSIITNRDQESRFEGKINHVSSTEPQPYIAANFSADGVCVGGRTMQQSYYTYMLEAAKKAGWMIEEIA
jgi:hypothetical protein